MSPVTAPIPSGSVMRMQSGPGAPPHQFDQLMARLAASAAPGVSVTGGPRCRCRSRGNRGEHRAVCPQQLDGRRIATQRAGRGSHVREICVGLHRPGAAAHPPAVHTELAGTARRLGQGSPRRGRGGRRSERRRGYRCGAGQLNEHGLEGWPPGRLVGSRRSTGPRRSRRSARRPLHRRRGPWAPGLDSRPASGVRRCMTSAAVLPKRATFTDSPAIWPGPCPGDCALVSCCSEA